MSSEQSTDTEARLAKLLERVARRFKTEPAREADLPAVVELFRETWADPRPPEEIERRFRRRFWENPVSRGEGSLLVCRSGEKLAGFAGMLDTDVVDGGKRVSAAYGVDMVILPAYRGFGIGHLLQSQLNDRADIVLEGNVNAAARAVVQGIGARDIAGPRAWRRWLSPVDALRGWRPGRLSFERIDEFDARFDDLWERASKAYPRVARRDRAVLQWRYGRPEAPGFETFGVIDGERLVGYFVIKPERLKGLLRKAIIVDFLFERAGSGDLEPAFRWLLSSLARRGKLCADIVVTHRETREVLEKLGFRPKTYDPGFMVHTTPHARERPELLDQDSWHLTFGDSDFFL